MTTPERDPRTGFAGWTRSQPTVLGAAAGVVAYGIVGFAYETFYDRLGVSPREVGFGYAETLLTAAFALVLFLLLFLGLALLHLAVDDLAFGLCVSRRARAGRRSWRRPRTAVLVLGATTSAVSAALGFSEVAVIGGFAAFFAFSTILGEGIERWWRAAAVAGAAAAPVRPWTFMWTVAIAQVAVLQLASTAVVSLERAGAVGSGAAVAVVYVLVLLEPPVTGLLLMRWYVERAARGGLPAARWFAPGPIAVAALAALSVSLTVLAVTSAAESSRAVRDGETSDTTLDRLTHGRVDCVAPVWTGSGPEADLPPSALFLGQAGGRAVLYEPGAGAIRVNAEDVTLLPASPAACVSP